MPRNRSVAGSCLAPPLPRRSVRPAEAAGNQDQKPANQKPEPDPDPQPQPTLASAEFKYYRINDNGQEVEYFNKLLEGVKVVKVAPKMYDVKDPAKSKHNHLEEIELRYEKITWTFLDGTIQHTDAWAERSIAEG